MRESPSKSADIICNTELETILRRELPNANYCVVDLEKHIDKERNVYDKKSMCSYGTHTTILEQLRLNAHLFCN